MWNGWFTKLAEQLINPWSTLPWILQALSVPAGFFWLLVPIKDAWSLLPQLFVAAKIRSYAVRKWFWSIPAFVQALSLVGMGISVLLLEWLWAWIAIILWLLVFYITSGVASVAFKDVVGKTIPKGKRWQLLAYRSVLGWIGALIVGTWVAQTLDTVWSNISIYVWLFLLSAILWIIAWVIFANIQEEAGATQWWRSAITEIQNAWQFLRTDGNLRRFIWTRGLLMAIPLAQPFFIVIGTNIVGLDISYLGIIVVASWLANIVSSPFWGRFADKSSRRLMMFIALAGLVNIALMISFVWWPESLQTIWIFALFVVLQVMIHGGARLSRKTYLLDFAPKEHRPSYVALANTMIGICTLIAAGIGLLASVWGSIGMLVLYAILLVFAGFGAWRLKEV